MELGMIGLGRMGASMAERLVRGGHHVVGYDFDTDARATLRRFGASEADSLGGLALQLGTPRVVWLMVPAGAAVDETIEALAPVLAAGDTIVDGGNSSYKDTRRRAGGLQARRIDYVDVGTSGGVWGLREGYSLMIGGDEAVVARLQPVFETLAPAPDRGWGRVGPNGAGHFVKMVHNGIEYGLMQAYAEGFALLKAKRDFDLDLHRISGIWRSGSVVRSWLLDLIGDALDQEPDLAHVAPYVADSGYGRETVVTAIELDVPAPVITLALLQRLRSRDPEAYYDRLLAVMRQQFGGHAIRKEGGS